MSAQRLPWKLVTKKNVEPGREKVGKHLDSILHELVSKSNDSCFVLDSTQYIVSNRPNLKHINNQREEEL